MKKMNLKKLLKKFFFQKTLGKFVNPTAISDNASATRRQGAQHNARVFAGDVRRHEARVQRTHPLAAPEPIQLRRHAKRRAEPVQSLGRSRAQRFEQRCQAPPRLGQPVVVVVLVRFTLVFVIACFILVRLITGIGIYTQTKT